MAPILIRPAELMCSYTQFLRLRAQRAPLFRPDVPRQNCSYTRNLSVTLWACRVDVQLHSISPPASAASSPVPPRCTEAKLQLHAQNAVKRAFLQSTDSASAVFSAFFTAVVSTVTGNFSDPPPSSDEARQIAVLGRFYSYRQLLEAPPL
jgi:hypothetical protein